MFLVSNVSSAVAGDKSITGTEVHGGKRLSGPSPPPPLSRYWSHFTGIIANLSHKPWDGDGLKVDDWERRQDDIHCNLSPHPHSPPLHPQTAFLLTLKKKKKETNGDIES